MNVAAFHPNHAADWMALGLHFAAVGMMAIGGASAVVPEMQRSLVGERNWLSDADFGLAVALGYAVPGPNVLFVPLIGWMIAGGWGAALALAAMVLPSSSLALASLGWMERHRERLAVRSYVQAMLPLTGGLLLSSSALLLWGSLRSTAALPNAALCAMAAASACWVVGTRRSPAWCVLAGAVLGSLLA